MRKRIKVYTRWILTFSILALSGCANEILHSDFTNYSFIYGDESNKQLLLNLARLANDDPVYYIQLGTISSQYQVTTALQFNGGNQRTTPPSQSSVNPSPSLANQLTLSGQANFGVVQTPIFSFVPLTGTNFVQAVLAPINNKVYLTFYDQGFGADLIARTVIARLEWQHICTNVVRTNFSVGAITIQSKGVDPKAIAYVANLALSYSNAVSLDTNAYLIRPGLMTNTNLLAAITNSVITGDDISWNMNSFVVQKRALCASLVDQVEKAKGGCPTAISIYTNSITLQTTNIPKSVLSFINASVPASAWSVSGIIVNTNCIPQSVQTLIANAGQTNVVLPLNDKESISLASFSPDMAACITNAISTNCVQITTNYEILVNSPDSPTYWKFLEFCADLRDAQNCRMLTVDTLTANTTTNVIYGKDKRNPALADVVNAIGANLSVAADTNGNSVVSQTQQTPHFIDRSYWRDFSPFTNSLNASTDATFFKYDTDPANLKILDASNLVQDIINKRITATTRTFESAMYWVAQEGGTFESMETNPPSDHIIYTHDEKGLYARVTTTNIIAMDSTGRPIYRQLRVNPTMTLTYDKYKTKPALCSVGYRGKVYRVVDSENDDENSNEEVFTMLSYLFAQTAISTQNLPVQQLIQVQ